MTINPTSPNGPQRPADPAELDRARTRPAQAPEGSGSPAKQAADSNPDPADSVQVSAEAQELARERGTRSTGSSLSPERLEEIGQRLATGFYDRPEVIDELARKLATHRDLNQPE